MKRRKLLMLIGSTATTTAVIGATAPPSHAFLPLLLRFLIGQGVRNAIRKRRLKRKVKKSRFSKSKLRSPKQKLRNRTRRKP